MIFHCVIKCKVGWVFCDYMGGAENFHNVDQLGAPFGKVFLSDLWEL